MPKRIMPLTDLQVKNVKPKDKNSKLSDGGGLYLLITPTGGKLWRFNYRFDGKEKTLFLKSYPEKSLNDARKDREEARQLLANGVDPGAVVKAQKEQDQVQKAIDANTFEKVAREWHEHKKPEWSDNPLLSFRVKDLMTFLHGSLTEAFTSVFSHYFHLLSL